MDIVQLGVIVQPGCIVKINTWQRAQKYVIRDGGGRWTMDGGGDSGIV